MSGLHRTHRPTGLILAGGRASRMGGGDKPLLMLGGRSILSRLVARLAPQCDGLLLSANGDPARFAELSAPVVADHPDDAGDGPLAGILAGLDHCAARGVETVLVVAGDMPFLPSDLAARLAAAREHRGDAVAAARSGGRSHPLASLWPVAARHALRQAIRDEGLRRVGAVVERLGTAWVDWPPEAVDPFANINTADDLDAAEALTAGHEW